MQTAVLVGKTALGALRGVCTSPATAAQDAMHSVTSVMQVFSDGKLCIGQAHMQGWRKTFEDVSLVRCGLSSREVRKHAYVCVYKHAGGLHAQCSSAYLQGIDNICAHTGVLAHDALVSVRLTTRNC